MTDYYNYKAVLRSESGININSNYKYIQKYKYIH